MKNYQKYCYYLLVLLLPLSVFTQSRNSRAEYGKYDAWELNRTSYSGDTSAAAVILSEYAANEWRRKTKREFHRRIKIFNPSAYDEWGTVTIRHSKWVALRGLKAQIAFINESGDLEEIKLRGDDFIRTKIVENVFETTFTFPNLRPGAILEYTYEMTSDYIIPYPNITDWTFQHSIPTLWSEYETYRLGAYEFATQIRGNINFYIEEKTLAQVSGQRDNVLIRRVMKDVPAFKKESFMRSAAVYVPQIRMFLSAIARREGTTWLMKDWPYQAKVLEEDENFGGILRGSREIISKANSLIESSDTDKKKFLSIFHFVRDEIVTQTGGPGHISINSGSLNFLLRDAQGTATEKNMLLITMLRAVGINSTPALVSTRNNGIVAQDVPSYRQYNRVLAATEIDGVLTLLDTFRSI